MGQKDSETEIYFKCYGHSKEEENIAVRGINKGLMVKIIFKIVSKR